MSEPILPERLRKQQKRKTPGRMRQLSLALFTLAAIALIAYGAYYFFMPKQEEFVLNFYTYASVGLQDFLETLPVRGTVIPEQVAIIAPKVGGTIEEVFVQEGQDVAAGDPLFRLYSAEIAAEKNAAETELGEARAELAQKEIIHERELEAERLKVLEAQEQLAAAEEQLELQKVLYEYGSIPRVELEKAEQAVEAAKRRITQSEWELELLIRRQEAEKAAIAKT
ncbi:MAG TPA: hypothetical protein DCQ17_03120, partial [Firmicutes bacterium]|nr:hypothetical protein [Bacillota bacterium]